jgi:hypothetical protein
MSSPMRCKAISSAFRPTAHQGQAISETKSIFMWGVLEGGDGQWKFMGYGHVPGKSKGLSPPSEREMPRNPEKQAELRPSAGRLSGHPKYQRMTKKPG